MIKYEIDLDFNAVISVEASNEEEAIAKAMEKARDDYGSEVADFADYTITLDYKEEN